jgi:hypothetical protein
MMVFCSQIISNLRRRATMSTAGLVIALGCSQAMAGDQPKTLGFAITSWLTASYETADGKEECPQGFALDAIQIYRSQLNAEQLKEFGVDTVADSRMRRKALARGPNGENVCWNPTLAKDPPMRTVQGRKGFGLNLDGVGTGAKTATTCPHQNFVSPDGKKTGIDNQWYRLIGCTIGWRHISDGYMEKNIDGELRDYGHALLVEVTGVDDERNDNDVVVNVYQAVETLVKDASGSGEIVPGASFHTVDGFKYTTKGRISNGTLSTDPIDFQFAFTGNTIRTYYYIRGMRLQVDMHEDGRRAAGLVAGYFDLETLREYMARMDFLVGLGHFSCPAMYAAATEFADGYLDPATGRCTALSAAFKIKAVSAFIIHDEKQTAESHEQKLSQAER